MFKVNKDTRTTSMTSFWCLYCWVWIYISSDSSVSLVNFEHEIAGWKIVVNSEAAVLDVCKIGIQKRIRKVIQKTPSTLSFVSKFAKGRPAKLLKTCVRHQSFLVEFFRTPFFVDYLWKFLHVIIISI